MYSVQHQTRTVAAPSLLKVTCLISLRAIMHCRMQCQTSTIAVPPVLKFACPSFLQLVTQQCEMRTVAVSYSTVVEVSNNPKMLLEGQSSLRMNCDKFSVKRSMKGVDIHFFSGGNTSQSAGKIVTRGKLSVPRVHGFFVCSDALWIT